MNTHRRVRSALGEASADRLFEVDDARQVGPAELVLRGVGLTIRPLEGLCTREGVSDMPL